MRPNPPTNIDDNNEGMSKYAVETDVPHTGKVASGIRCPDCGSAVLVDGPVIRCPTHGSKPFERR